VSETNTRSSSAGLCLSLSLCHVFPIAVLPGKAYFQLPSCSEKGQVTNEISQGWVGSDTQILVVAKGVPYEADDSASDSGPKVCPVAFMP
jgi:hypothetical protein